MNVSCEACHGPGSRHVDWADKIKPPYRADDDMGLAVQLRSNWSEAWKFPEPNAKFAQRDDAYRVQTRDDLVEPVLRRGLAQLPKAADLHHALGLLLVRKGATAAALTELEQAAQLAPDDARYTYVYAVALHSMGQGSQAQSLLRDADVRFPNRTDILGALISMSREAGDAQAALIYARKLAAVLPEDPGVQRLLAELEGSK